MKEYKTGKTLINWLGLLEPVALISYTAAVVISPLAYPGYNALAQAVSDLSASNAPSRVLWDQLNALSICGLISVMMVCVYIGGKANRTIRMGIYLFAAMNWISSVGYAAFPLSDSGYAGTFQDFMHGYVVTPLVIVLSIVSLVLIIIGGVRGKRYTDLSVWAAVTLTFMCLGAVGVAVVPGDYFGIPERFSVFAAMGFNAVLGMYLFKGMDG